MDMLTVKVFETAEEASAAGYVYRAPITGLTLKEAVVVRQGTVEGNPSVDLILEDAQGNKFVALVKGRLLKMIPCG